jgi:hypothetical protein
MALKALGCVINEFIGSIATLFSDTSCRSNAILNCICNS